MAMKAPIAIPELDLEASVSGVRKLTTRRLGPKPTTADRDELLRLWDALSDDGKRVVLFTAVAAAKDEGLPAGMGR